MGKYDHYEELEEQAYNDKIKPKKKPKKEKKEWKQNEHKPRRKFDYRKGGKSNHPKRI
tara:strand:+ start:129 stop:302 length:174 start_codon:yes stop_codon:yes gene_type:complete